MRNNHKVAEQNPTHTVIEVIDPCTHETYIIAVDTPDYHKWMAGAPVQEAFPYLDSWKREILITGIGPDSWDKIVVE